VRKVLKIAKEPISLETPIGDEEDSHLGDFIEDKNAVLPIDAAIQSNLRETTTRVLASLTPREERVLRMRSNHRLDFILHLGSTPQLLADSGAKTALLFRAFNHRFGTGSRSLPKSRIRCRRRVFYLRTNPVRIRCVTRNRRCAGRRIYGFGG
jgi:hypothetical protein